MSKLQTLRAPNGLIMKALIIYDNFAAAAKANATLKRSTESLAFDVRWNVSPWRVDMLKFPPTAEEALTDALDAHLVVLAGRMAQPVSFWLLEWLEQWAKSRRVEEAAMAVFGVGKALNPSSSATSNVVQFVNHYGLGLFYVESNEAEDIAAIRVDSVHTFTPGIKATVSQRVM